MKSLTIFGQEQRYLFEKYLESNIDRSGIGLRRESIDLPAFTFYANEQFDSGSDFHYGNEHITMDNINQVNSLRRTTTLQGIGSQSNKRLWKIGRDEGRIEKQRSLPSFKDLSRSSNTAKKEVVQLLQRYNQIKDTEVKNKDRNVPVSSKVESGFSEPTEKIGESNRNKITGVFKDDPSSQKDGLLKTATSNDKFLQENKIRYKKSLLKETTNQNSLEKVEVDPSDLQDVYSEEERLNKVKKTLSLREKPNRNERHEISSDSLENSCIGTLDEIGSTEGGKEKQINRSLREVPLGLAKSGSSKEDFDWKGQKPPQNQHQAADLSNSQRDEMLTEALKSPQSVSVSTPHKMGAKSGKDNVAPKSPDSSREELTNFEEKDMVEDEDQDSDEVDQIESRTSQPSQVKRFVGKKVNKKSKKVKNKKSKNKGKTKDYEQDELKIKEDDQIENFEKNDKSLKPLIPIEDVKDFSKIDKDEFLQDIINPKNQIPMLKIKLSKLQFEYLRSMGFGRDSWSKPFSNLRMEFNDLYEADRRIASVQRQFYAVQVTYMWKEEGETLSPELKEMGKILRFDEPFPDFQDQTSDQLNRLY
ncbi:hypothetical protein DFH28DRAFT_923344 [Melampsora americana]|nr:hypothetical protein DFH28DRAFT_923344 [Melampsora americana]